MTNAVETFDVGANHLYAEQSDLIEYLPEGYAERFTEFGQPLVGVRGLENAAGFEAICDSIGKETVARLLEDQTPAEIVRERLFDHVDLALLTGSKPFYAPSSIPNKDYGNALCTAYNDYTIDEWLAVDERFRYTMTVNHQDPSAAAEEIGRIGDHPQVVGVNLSPRSDKPFGNKEYDPIHEAAEQAGLVITLRPTFGSAGVHGHPPTAGGYPTNSTEREVIQPAQVQAHIQSYVFEGAFEKFPGLRLAAIGWGWSWLPGYLWRIDSEWKNLHTEIPWVEQPPSEYIRDHVRFDVQPVEEIESGSYIETVYEWIDGADLLMYGSGFPEEAVTDPDGILTSLPHSDRRRILADNAADLFSPA